MKRNVGRELAALEGMTASELREKYRELFGDASRSGNRQWLLRRCAWRVQALAEGDLPERARERALAIANDADVRVIPPPVPTPLANAPRRSVRVTIDHDPRMPLPGTVLRRVFKGREHVVTVTQEGFEYQGRRFRSLSAVAHAISGAHWNGFHFFKKALIHAKQPQESQSHE